MILSIAAFGAIFTDKIEFVQQIKEYFGLGKVRNLYSKNKYIDYMIYFIHHILNCPCISFWIALFYLPLPYCFLVYWLSTEIYKRMSSIF